MTTNNTLEERFYKFQKEKGHFIHYSNVLNFMEFIQSELDLARRKGAEEMKRKCLGVIPEITMPKTQRECGANVMRDQIVENICEL